MTRNETFKRRVRARMAKTGEKYGAARRSLIEKGGGGRHWASEPQQSDALITERTGRDWDAWRSEIEAWPGHADGHAAVAQWLQSQHGLDGWWAQSVTVGWERISGRRLAHQMPDGTFTANASATIAADAAAIRELLLDENGRTDLFPGMDAELRSRPTSKNVRIGFEGTSAEIALVAKEDGRVTITVQHSKLPSADDVPHWKAFWADWFAALDGA